MRISPVKQKSCEVFARFRANITCSRIHRSLYLPVFIRHKEEGQLTSLLVRLFLQDKCLSRSRVYIFSGASKQARMRRYLTSRPMNINNFRRKVRVTEEKITFKSHELYFRCIRHWQDSKLIYLLFWNSKVWYQVMVYHFSLRSAWSVSENKLCYIKMQQSDGIWNKHKLVFILL